jgi:hypothetical protein
VVIGGLLPLRRRPARRVSALCVFFREHSPSRGGSLYCVPLLSLAMLDRTGHKSQMRNVNEVMTSHLLLKAVLCQ